MYRNGYKLFRPGQYKRPRFEREYLGGRRLLGLEKICVLKSGGARPDRGARLRLPYRECIAQRQINAGRAISIGPREGIDDLLSLLSGDLNLTIRKNHRPPPGTFMLASTSRRNFALAWAASLRQAGTCQSGQSEWSRRFRRDVPARPQNDPDRLGPASAAAWGEAAFAYGLGPRCQPCGATRQARF